MSQLTLQIAGPSQAESIVGFVNESSRSRFLHGGYSIDGGQFGTLSTKGKFLVVEKDGTLAGCIYVEPNAGTSLLDYLVVNSHMRRSGIGSQLLQAGEELCQNAKAKFIHVQVVNLNCEVVKFWYRRGYVEFDELPCQCESRSSLRCSILKMAKHMDRICPGF